MSDEEIYRIIDSAFYDSANPSIGLSGGEAFLYFGRLRRIVRYASQKGALVAINTNAFWGRSPRKANEYVEHIKSDGARKLVLSTDDFHTPYVTEECVVNVVEACLHHHLEVDIQFVTSKRTARLHQFLSRHSDQLLNISAREIPVHPVGRARDTISSQEIIGKPRIPTGRCPSAIPSVSAAGKIIPCCNSAGHLDSLELGDARTDDLPMAYESFKHHPLFYTLWKYGPVALHPVAKCAGLLEPASGYIDQCHLCYEIFKDRDVADAVKVEAAAIASEDLYRQFMSQYESFSGKNSICTQELVMSTLDNEGH